MVRHGRSRPSMPQDSVDWRDKDGCFHVTYGQLFSEVLKVSIRAFFKRAIEVADCVTCPHGFSDLICDGIP